MIVLKKTFEQYKRETETALELAKHRAEGNQAQQSVLRAEINQLRAEIHEHRKAWTESLDLVSARLTDLIQNKDSAALIKAVIVSGMLSSGSANTPNHITHYVRLAEAYLTSLGGNSGNEVRNT